MHSKCMLCFIVCCCCRCCFCTFNCLYRILTYLFIYWDKPFVNGCLLLSFPFVFQVIITMFCILFVWIMKDDGIWFGSIWKCCIICLCSPFNSPVSINDRDEFYGSFSLISKRSYGFARIFINYSKSPWYQAHT